MEFKSALIALVTFNQLKAFEGGINISSLQYIAIGQGGNG